MKSIKQMLMGIFILLLTPFIYYILAGLIELIVPIILGMSLNVVSCASIFKIVIEMFWNYGAKERNDLMEI